MPITHEVKWQTKQIEEIITGQILRSSLPHVYRSYLNSLNSLTRIVLSFFSSSICWSVPRLCHSNIFRGVSPEVCDDLEVRSEVRSRGCTVFSLQLHHLLVSFPSVLCTIFWVKAAQLNSFDLERDGSELALAILSKPWRVFENEFASRCSGPGATSQD